jgi:hypothetical protein
MSPIASVATLILVWLRKRPLELSAGRSVWRKAMRRALRGAGQVPREWAVGEARGFTAPA